VSRGGITTIRAEEEMRNLAGGLFGGIMGGGGGGTAGISVGIGMEVFHSLPIGFGIWAAAIAGSYALARSLFGRASAKRGRQLSELIDKLEAQVVEIVASRTPSAQMSAGAARSLPAGPTRAPVRARRRAALAMDLALAPESAARLAAVVEGAQGRVVRLRRSRARRSAGAPQRPPSHSTATTSKRAISTVSPSRDSVC